MDIGAEFKLSEDQSFILENYEDGFASVLATPGSGKTTIITHLIKKFIYRKKVDPRQILVLTLTESAAREFKNRTLSSMKNKSRTPSFLTIHSFCNRILSKFHSNYNDFVVLPDTKKNEIIESILLKKGFQLKKKDENNSGDEIDYLELFRDSVIPLLRRDREKISKIRELSKLDIKELRQKIGNIYNHHLKCLYNISDIVEEFEAQLEVQKYIDFDTMINETYNLLKRDTVILEYLRGKYKYILEDEAQDSNSVQSQILYLLAGENGNYIRVGDPNQSIFTTFTGADYKELMEFYRNNIQLEIKQSNRSNQYIIDISNYLVECYKESFPSHHVKIRRGTKNPEYGWVKINEFKDFQEEVENIAEQIEMLLKKEKNITIAVLTRTNNQANEIYKRITGLGFEAILHGNREEDFFNNPTVKKISALTGYILFPDENERILNLLKLFGFSPEFIKEWFEDTGNIYSYLKATANNTFLKVGDEETKERIFLFSKKIFRLFDYIYLSVSEILELINNMFIEDNEEKAVARLLHKMWLRSEGGYGSIYDFYLWLARHSGTKIKQEILNEHEEDYSVPQIIHILTIHKAKGLQWDAVFIPNFSKWDFKDDTWKGPSEKKDLKSVVLSLLENTPRNVIRQKLTSEEIREGRRVAYVGITRAKKYLHLSCSQIGLNDRKNEPSEIFHILNEYMGKDE